jgi:ABC-2 type transport system permease protein
MTETINQTTNYKLTLIQRLLGRNYKWWYVMVFNFKSASSYVWSDLFYYLKQVLTAYIAIFIWSYSNRIDIDDTLNYLIFGNIFLSLTLLNNNWRMSDEVFEGKMSSKLILPVSIFKYYFFNAIVYSFKVSIVIIFYLPLLLWFRDKLFFDLSGFFVITIFLPIALLIKFFYNFIIASSVFWFTNNEGVISFSETVVDIFSGSLIPLTVINNPYLASLFFATFLHHPMQIYLGKYDFNQTLMVFAGGITWCVVLYFLAKWVFKMGLKRK